VLAGSSVGDLVAIDNTLQRQLTTSSVVSPTSLIQWLVDVGTGSTAASRILAGVGSNCRDLAVSPTGGRLALACGGGNGASPPYTIWDISTSDLSHDGGEWVVGAYPRAAAFSRDGTRLLASDGSSLEVFDAESHASLVAHTFDLPDAGCTLGEVRRVGMSRGGRLAIGLATCGNDESSLLIWLRL
jgi:WD40 repeat protein